MRRGGQLEGCEWGLGFRVCRWGASKGSSGQRLTPPTPPALPPAPPRPTHPPRRAPLHLPPLHRVQVSIAMCKLMDGDDSVDDVRWLAGGVAVVGPAWQEEGHAGVVAPRWRQRGATLCTLPVPVHAASLPGCLVACCDQGLWASVGKQWGTVDTYLWAETCGRLRGSGLWRASQHPPLPTAGDCGLDLPSALGLGCAPTAREPPPASTWP